MVRMTFNAVAAAAGVVAAGLRGERVISESVEQSRRHAICQTNQCGRYLADRDRCSRCGCWMGVKSWLRPLPCPVGLW